MRRKLRLLSLIAVAILPGWLKRRLYRLLFGYQISPQARIGIAVLDCAALTVGAGTRIASGVAFLRCGDVRIGANVMVGPLNLFRGGRALVLDDYSQVMRLNVVNAIPDHDCTNEPDSSFHLGYGSIVTSEHRIDFTDAVTIGRCSILGGRNSSIWTHNRRSGKAVQIGSYCYVGSEIRMAPGARVPDCSIVSLASVLVHPVAEKYSLIGGMPAKRLRGLTAADAELIFGKTRRDLPDQVYPVIPVEPVTQAAAQ